LLKFLKSLSLCELECILIAWISFTLRQLVEPLLRSKPCDGTETRRDQRRGKERRGRREGREHKEKSK
jgi:hypothetical protein